VERWIELEPGYRASVELTKETRDDPIYAAFVRGKWTVVGPTNAHTFIGGGRAVLDKDGRVLNVQLWGGDRPARPTFGPFNDQ
jgi:hypothetical protein